MAGRSTITQRIALQGGSDIETQLLRLGKAGEEAFANIQKAAAQVQTPPALSDLKAKLDEIAAASKNFRGDVNSLGSALSTAAERIGFVTAAFISVGGAIGGAVFALVKSGSSAADSAKKTSQALGISIKSYGELQFATEQAGVSSDEFAGTLDRLNANINTTAKSTKVSDTALGALHIRVKSFSGQLRSADDVLLDVADAFHRMPDGAKKSALAIELFGRTVGPLLIPLLNQGRAGIKALGADAEHLGVVFTDAQAKVGNEFTDALGRLTRATKAVKDQLGLVFAPALTEGANHFAELIANNRDRLVALANALLQQVTPAIDDFIAALSGDPTAIKSSIIFAGAIAVKDFAVAVKAAFVDVIIPTIKVVSAAFQTLAAFINDLFGTQFTGAELAVVLAVTRITNVVGILFSVLRAGVSGISLLVASFGALPVVIALVIAGLIALAAWFVATHWDQIVAGWNATWEAFKAIPQAAWAVIEADASDALLRLQAVWQGLKDFFQLSWDLIKIIFTNAWNDIANLARDGVNEIGNVWNGLVGLVQDAWSSITAFIGSQIGTVLGWLQSVWDKAKSAAAAVHDALSTGNSGGGNGATGSFAGGGRVAGAGSATSDSIPAWLSNGEWVIQAKAVRHYGHQLMAAINGMRLPRNFPGFDTGGLVNGLTHGMLAGVPRMALGGPIEATNIGPSGRAVTLNFGGPDVFDMIAPHEVAEKLERFAVGRQARSAGRKPAWYGSR